MPPIHKLSSTQTKATQCNENTEVILQFDTVKLQLFHNEISIFLHHLVKIPLVMKINRMRFICEKRRQL